MSDLIGTGEVAAMLGVSAQTVRKLVAGNLIPGYRIGRTHRFVRAEVQSWLEDSRFGEKKTIDAV